MGTLSVLNCGLGDLELTFDAGNDAERDKAKQMIQDMLKRGELRKVKRFDPERSCYVVQDGPAKPEKKGRAGKFKEKKVPMDKAHATGVGRTAGG